jgi:hypothetical protein
VVALGGVDVVVREGGQLAESVLLKQFGHRQPATGRLGGRRVHGGLLVIGGGITGAGR